MNYRITTRGGQNYIQPQVGTSFTECDRTHVKDTLRGNGYFVSVVSPGRIAYSKITGNDCKSLLELLG